MRFARILAQNGTTRQTGRERAAGRTYNRTHVRDTGGFHVVRLLRVSTEIADDTERCFRRLDFTLR